jgi:hypothetical protein
MISKIYLDMDGVLANFNKRYIEIFNEHPSRFKGEDWNEKWKYFVGNNNFTKLEKYPGCDDLMYFVDSTGIQVEILSSSGGKGFHKEVEEQKMQWLMQNNIPYKANIVPGSRLKANYAKPDIILIDDTNYVIDDFNIAGGIGILHENAEDTIEKLRILIDIA